MIAPQSVINQLVISNLAKQTNKVMNDFQQFFFNQTGMWQSEDPAQQPKTVVESYPFAPRIPFLNKILNQFARLYRSLKFKSFNLEYQKVFPVIKPSQIVLNKDNTLIDTIVNKIFLKGVDLVGGKVNSKLAEIDKNKRNEMDNFRKKYLSLIHPFKTNINSIVKKFSGDPGKDSVLIFLMKLFITIKNIFLTVWLYIMGLMAIAVLNHGKIII